MANNPKVFVQWCLREAANASMPERIMVYRNLADVCGDEKEAKRLMGLADELEAAEKRCAEFAFEVSQKET